MSHYYVIHLDYSKDLIFQVTPETSKAFTLLFQERNLHDEGYSQDGDTYTPGAKMPRVEVITAETYHKRLCVPGVDIQDA